MSQDFIGPIAIGGVGGSGTRVVSELLQKMGFYFGGCQNKSLDSLAYTLIFKRLPALKLTQTDFESYADLLRRVICDDDLSASNLSIINALVNDPDELRLDVKLLRIAHDDVLNNHRPAYLGKWGWKEPNTHILADRFLDYWPNFKFICVYRDGRDMAFSQNQNQQKFWGKGRYPLTPAGSLSYWCDAHRRMLELKKLYPDRILFVSLEQLCEDTELSLNQVLSFSETIVSDSQFETLCTIPKPPQSIGRWKVEDADFAASDVEFVEYFMDEAKFGK